MSPLFLAGARVITVVIKSNYSSIHYPGYASVHELADAAEGHHDDPETSDVLNGLPFISGSNANNALALELFPIGEWSLDVVFDLKPKSI